MGDKALGTQVLDVLEKRLAAFQELLDIACKQYDSISKGSMDEFDERAELQNDLISRINQFNSEVDALISDTSFQETQIFAELMARTEESMHKLHETYQKTQSLLGERRDEIGKELLMLKTRSKVLNSYKQGGSRVP